MHSAKSCSPSPFMDMPPGVGAMMQMHQQALPRNDGMPNAVFYNPQAQPQSQAIPHTKMKKRKKKSDRVERNQRKKQRKKMNEIPMIEIGVMAGGHASGGTILTNNVNPFISSEQMMAMNSIAANGAQPKRVKKAKRKKKKKTHKHMAMHGKLPNGAVIMQQNMHSVSTPPFMMTKTP